MGQIMKICPKDYALFCKIEPYLGQIRVGQSGLKPKGGPLDEKYFNQNRLKRSEILC